jgi:uncharacterized OsmC-like protein
MTATLDTPKTTINGIDTAALRQCIAACEADPRHAHTSWRISSRWMGGTRSDHHVDGFGIGQAHVDRKFVMKTDEPHELLGTNQYPNPQEYLLSAMNACMMVGYAAVAALMGIELTKLEVEVSGDIDLRGFLGIDASVPNGYTKLQQTVRVAGNGTEEQFRKLHATVLGTSPNFWNITRPIQVTSDLVIG